MKIAQVSLRFDAPGGVETNVREVARGLRAAGDEVTVFASDLYDEGRWERRSDWNPTVDGLPVRRFPVARRAVPFVTMPMMAGLIDALSGEPFDVLHAHSHRYGHVLETAAVARRRRIPLVVSTHYHPADRGEPPLKRGLLRCQDVLFGMTAYRAASALVVETALEASLLREFAPADTIRIIPPGVDLDEWDRPGPGSPPGGLPARYILYSGRVARNKGLPTLFAALAGIPPAERLPLVVMGRDWGERPSLERLASELRIVPNIVWLGHVGSPADYRAVMRGAALFVLPSEWEAFGLVLLEAMAARVPVVASAVGGVPEVLSEGRAGRLVPFGEAPALASAIRGLLADDGERRRLVEAGRARVQDLTWAKAVERHRALYRELTTH